jgi:hypothetical protein
MPIAIPVVRYRRVILQETDSPVIFLKSENDLRFLLIMKADIKSAAKERSRSGNSN